MLQITDDLKTLDKLVEEAKPEEILKTLKDYADKLWQNRGDLYSWGGVDVATAKTVWKLQEELELLHVVLFNTKNENKIREIYKLVVSPETLDLRYGMFYAQLNDFVFRAGNLKYGQHQMVGNGRMLDFSDYLNNLINLRYVLACGQRDNTVYHMYDGAVAKHIENTRKPPERKKKK